MSKVLVCFFSAGGEDVSVGETNQIGNTAMMAKTIVDYRRLHGDIKSLEDLRLSKDFPSEVIRRLEPYVEY